MRAKQTFSEDSLASLFKSKSYMIKPIIQLGNEVLRKRSYPVENFQDRDLASLIKDLSDTLDDAKKRFGYGRGVAAQQIGVLKRVIFIDTRELKGSLVNPRVIWKSDRQIEVWDSCLSFNVAFFNNLLYISFQ